MNCFLSVTIMMTSSKDFWKSFKNPNLLHWGYKKRVDVLITVNFPVNTISERRFLELNRLKTEMISTTHNNRQNNMTFIYLYQGKLAKLYRVEDLKLLLKYYCFYTKTAFTSPQCHNFGSKKLCRDNTFCLRTLNTTLIVKFGVDTFMFRDYILL